MFVWFNNFDLIYTNVIVEFITNISESAKLAKNKNNMDN